MQTVKEEDFVEENDASQLANPVQQPAKSLTLQKSNLTDDIESGSSDGDLQPSGLDNGSDDDGPPAVPTNGSSDSNNDDQPDLEAGESNDDNIIVEEEEEEEEDCENGYLKVGRRLVPNCCAICLCEYEVDDKIVSSCSCKHVFHLDCMVHWLVKMQDGTPCPVCRQDFTDLVAHRRERRIRWAAEQSFDQSAITWSR